MGFSNFIKAKLVLAGFSVIILLGKGMGVLTDGASRIEYIT